MGANKTKEAGGGGGEERPTPVLVGERMRDLFFPLSAAAVTRLSDTNSI